ncbi:MAG: carbohydrate ABC transporter permease [Bacillota bacterium]|nr:carbohydrate ABC transporter permease [Bacillota bacterium]
MIVEIYPLYFVLIASISNPQLVALNEISIWPKDITFEGYINVFKNDSIWIGYSNSIFYAVVGTAVNLLFTITCAYCMARKPAFTGKGLVLVFFVFTMYFSGGLIPYYILIRDLNLIDNRAVMIVPGALSVFNMIIVRTYIQNNIPQSLFESARIDGYGDIGMYLKITLPLSKPIIAVMSLYFLVGHWNSYFSAMIFLPSLEKAPLQLVLRRILILNEVLMNISMDSMSTMQIQDYLKRLAMAESMKYAVIYISCLPVLIAYPFVQKYFVKGVMIGAIKG